MWDRASTMSEASKSWLKSLPLSYSPAGSACFSTGQVLGAPGQKLSSGLLPRYCHELDGECRQIDSNLLLPAAIVSHTVVIVNRYLPPLLGNQMSLAYLSSQFGLWLLICFFRVQYYEATIDACSLIIRQKRRSCCISLQHQCAYQRREEGWSG